MIARDPERLACTSWQGLSSPDGCARANHRGSRSRADQSTDQEINQQINRTPVDGSDGCYACRLAQHILQLEPPTDV